MSMTMIWVYVNIVGRSSDTSLLSRVNCTVPGSFDDLCNWIKGCDG